MGTHHKVTTLQNHFPAVSHGGTAISRSEWLPTGFRWSHG